MKNNWLKPISFTSIFEFEVDPYMEWLSFAFTLSALLYLRVIGGTNFLFIDEWREYISRVFIFAFGI